MALLGALSGCAGALSQYKPPPIDGPHANVEVRMRYAAFPTPFLTERIAIDGRNFVAPPRQKRLAMGMIDERWVRVAPGVHMWGLGAMFSYVTTRVEDQPVNSDYVCGPNGDICADTTIVPIEVQDRTVVAGCRAQVQHAMNAGATYVVDFEFFGNANCRATVTEASRSPPG